MKKSPHPFALQDICDAINLGLMIIDRDMQVVFWNQWLVERTQIQPAQALGNKLDAVFGEPMSPAFTAGVKRVLRYGLPVLLSNALHRAPLPLYRGPVRDIPSRIDQSIVISAMPDAAGERCCMVQIQDASRAVKRENILRAYSRKLRYDASTDSLTGIPNRRSFDENSLELLVQAKTRKTSLSVFMIDIDFFKQYNDFYGHAAGDKTLKAVADALSTQVLRSTDLVARYGGEEFIVAMTGLDRDDVDNFAEKIRATVLQCGLPHAHSTVAEHVTISIGVCTGVPATDITMANLIECADQALYEAKRKGRNRIFVAERV